MILTIKDGYDKHDGTDLPMFSRTGKSTVTQHMQFTQHKQPKLPAVLESIDSLEGSFEAKPQRDPMKEM